MNRYAWILVIVLCLLPVLPGGGCALAAAQSEKTSWTDTGSPPGIYFYWYEPTFYTGFAPRCQDPARIHIRLGRGNQTRITTTLGPEQIGNYLADLNQRRRTVEALLEQGILALTQNREFESFCAALDRAETTSLLSQKKTLPPDEFQAKSLAVMKMLNPGRVFHIRRPAEAVFEQWRQILRQEAGKMDTLNGRIELTNRLLPGRINLFESSAAIDSFLVALTALARQAEQSKESLNLFYAEASRFLGQVTGSIYPVKDGFIEANEFTAIYPTGTVQAWVNWQGKRLPDFAATGIWPLIPRMKGKGILGMVDYISTNPGYGFVPMLPYQYAGGIEYNAFHNPGIRCPLAGSRILPKEWQQADGIRDTKKPFINLWITSRGPVSHGCTRLSAGHILEMRHLLPSATKVLEKVVTFRNLPQCYDLFDIDGNGTEEVMGVKFFLAYAHKEDRIPYKVYAPNNRKPFYEWLYAGDARFDEAGNAWISNALSCAFAGRKAYEGSVYEKPALWEAEYETDRIQFFKTLPVSFESPQGFEVIRELGRIGTGYNPNFRNLMLKSEPKKEE